MKAPRIPSRASRPGSGNKSRLSHKTTSLAGDAQASALRADVVTEEDEAQLIRKRFQDIEDRRVREWENYQRLQRVAIEESNPIVFLDVSIQDSPAGRLIIELYCDTVPETADNFRSLVTGEKLYHKNGTKLDYVDASFFKMEPGVAIYCGELANQSLSASGVIVRDESFAIRHTKRGFLSMVPRGPNNNGSVFCITLDSAPHLDFKQVVFGRVVDGLGVLDKLEQISTTKTGQLKVPASVPFCGSLTGKRPTGVFVPFEDTKGPGEESERDDMSKTPVTPDVKESLDVSVEAQESNVEKPAESNEEPNIEQPIENIEKPQGWFATDEANVEAGNKEKETVEDSVEE